MYLMYFLVVTLLFQLLAKHSSADLATMHVSDLLKKHLYMHR